MASAFSHAVVAFTIGQGFDARVMNRRALCLGALCSIAPDFDVIGFYLGIEYGDLWGHRGMTHSLVFAAALSAALTGLCYRGKSTKVTTGMGLYLFLCTASHGVLDAMTNGGLGVAFFSPFDEHRYFFGVRPILVSPIEIPEFFTRYGLHVLASEATWLWLPSLAALLVLRTRSNRYKSSSMRQRP